MQVFDRPEAALFNTWQREHPGGLYAQRMHGGKWRIHKAGCPHYGSGDAFSGKGFTPKIGFDDPLELLQWPAKTQSIACKTCNPL